MPDEAFRLTACREVMNAHPEAVRIERQVIGIEQAVPVDAGLAVTMCRVLVETTCKTVCRERGRKVPTRVGLGGLIQRTVAALPLRAAEEPDTDPQLAKGIRLIAKGLDKMVTGISVVRNAHGSGAHGADAYAPLLDERYAEIVARATDAAIGLMFRLHVENPIALDDEDETERYESGDDFNVWIDDQYEPFEVLGSVLAASEVLYYTDRTAYDAQLNEFVREGREAEGS